MNRLVAIILALALPGLTGCHLLGSHGDRGFYPLGFYGVNSTNDFATVRAAGFNLITGPAERGFLAAARAQGLKVLASPGTAAGPDFDPARARQTVRHFDAHPALWAWYLVDEPDFNGISPRQVQAAARAVKSVGPAKPTALVIYQGYQARDYANLTDILMVDRYPIPWLPLANFGQHVEMARLAVPAKRPLIAVLQAFDWSCFPEVLPGETDLRPPTYDELRCMTYEALARGANGLFFFAYEAGGWKIRDHPETWSALQRVVAEVNARRPLFQAQHRWWARSHVFGDPKLRFNAALQSSVTSCRLRVRAGNDAVPPGDYILAVNNTAERQTYSFTVPADVPEPKGGQRKTDDRAARRTGEVPVIGEERAVALRAGWITDEYAPYAVHVYGPLW